MKRKAQQSPCYRIKNTPKHRKAWKENKDRAPHQEEVTIATDVKNQGKSTDTQLWHTYEG